VISRLNYGQIREAVAGRIAEASGQTLVVPSLNAPTSADLRAQLAENGLSADGMEQLMVDGETLHHRSTVGPVYWGPTFQLAHDRLSSSEEGFPFGENEVAILVDRGALVVAADLLGDGTQLPFEEVEAALLAKGIEARQTGGGVSFSFSSDKGGTSLRDSVSHPWVDGVMLSRVPGHSWEVASATSEVERLEDSGAPEVLVSAAKARVLRAIETHFSDDRIAESLSFDTTIRRSGRAVIAPGPELTLEQVGLPEEMAWQLFSDELVA